MEALHHVGQQIRSRLYLDAKFHSEDFAVIKECYYKHYKSGPKKIFGAYEVDVIKGVSVVLNVVLKGFNRT